MSHRLIQLGTHTAWYSHTAWIFNENGKNEMWLGLTPHRQLYYYNDT